MSTNTAAAVIELPPPTSGDSLPALVQRFVETARDHEAGFLRLGRLRYEIEAMLPAGQKAFGLLVKAGATRGTVSNAGYAAAAWARVVAGEITEDDYRALTFPDCVFLARLCIFNLPLSDLLRVRRQHGLDDSSSIVLAKLSEPEKAEEWAATTRRHELPAAALKASIEAGEVVTHEQLTVARGSGSGIENFSSVAATFERLIAKAGGLSFVDTLTVEQARALAYLFRGMGPFIAAVGKRARDAG